MPRPTQPLVYLAGPLFTPGDRWYLERLDALCRDLGYATYLPHRDAGLADRSQGTRFFFLRDLEALQRIHLVVAVLHGTDVDSGTAWEMGYAYAKGIPVLGVVEDTRVPDPDNLLNPMIRHSLTALCRTPEEVAAALKKHAPLV
ncbi:MAG TPA: nucleoside 2-deoxyribosyltransferase [Anaerolineae bacterium]|nr:nucleoside 2-deoxyribosyltransferase [Anaerolineae bacterium]